MFKSVLIIIFVIILLFVIRTVLQRLKQPSPRIKPLDHQNMVQCQHCKVYIPRDDAIIENNNFFCSTQHLNDWNQTT